MTITTRRFTFEITSYHLFMAVAGWFECYWNWSNGTRCFDRLR